MVPGLLETGFAGIVPLQERMIPPWRCLIWIKPGFAQAKISLGCEWRFLTCCIVPRVVVARNAASGILKHGPAGVSANQIR
jgi:hypothetical protein